MKILVLGSKGQLGLCLTDNLIRTDHEVIYACRVEIDVVDFNETSNRIREINPDVVINATAYTAVDKAEKEKKLADSVNHHAVANISNICADINCWLIHISTDYVFDGNATQPYKETDKTNPQCIYGVSKLNGELAIKSSGCKYLIIRTAWVFSEYGNNFMKTMLRLGADRNKLSVVGDQTGCPTYAQDIAKVIVRILDELGDQEVIGTYNFCGDRECTWYELALEIFDNAQRYGMIVPEVIESVSTSEYPTSAKRPSYSVLDNNKIYKVFDVVPSDWRNGITSVLTSLRSTET